MTPVTPPTPVVTLCFHMWRTSHVHDGRNALLHGRCVASSCSLPPSLPIFLHHFSPLRKPHFSHPISTSQPPSLPPILSLYFPSSPSHFASSFQPKNSINRALYLTSLHTWTNTFKPSHTHSYVRAQHTPQTLCHFSLLASHKEGKVLHLSFTFLHTNPTYPTVSHSFTIFAIFFQNLLL